MVSDTSNFLYTDDITLPHDAEITLKYVIRMMPDLINWLIKSGVGYNEFSVALKTLFYNEAIKELDYIKQKKTDSAISLLSGLNRRDVRVFCQKYGEYQFVDQYALNIPISVPARVVGLWLNLNLPKQIAFSGEQQSFENLVKQISSEKHPKSILLELKRLGIVHEKDDQVVLHNSSFTPNPNLDESKQLFSHNLTDHIAAGISNLTKETNFLEQAIFADELTPESVEKLKELSVNLWNLMSKAIISAASEHCKQDIGSNDADQRFRLGIYQYNE